jgi:hypothetical protein
MIHEGAEDMNASHKLAQLLVSCWRLSGETSKIPTSHGVLDRALKSSVEKKAFPDWALASLNFADSRIGLQCIELPDVLDWAQRSQLTTAPNPSYETTEVQISQRVAQHLLNELGITHDSAVKIGKALRAEVDKATGELAEFEHSRIEEY